MWSALNDVRLAPLVGFSDNIMEFSGCVRGMKFDVSGKILPGSVWSINLYFGYEVFLVLLYTSQICLRVNRDGVKIFDTRQESYNDRSVVT